MAISMFGMVVAGIMWAPSKVPKGLKERRASKVILALRETKETPVHKALRASKVTLGRKGRRDIRVLMPFGILLGRTAVVPLTPLVTLRPMTERLGIGSMPMVATSVTHQARELFGLFSLIRGHRVPKVTTGHKAI
jgi:hypothetical protein